MQRRFRRLVLIASCGAVVLGLAAAPAQAATTAITGPAISSTNAARMFGYLITDVPVVWQFQFGTTPSLGGTTTLKVQRASSKPVLVAANLFRLRPGKRYYYRLIAFSAVAVKKGSYYYYYLVPSHGRTLSFTTRKLGRLVLLDTTIHVKKGRARIKLMCASTQSCSGSLQIKTGYKVNGTFKRVSCVSRSFSIAPGTKKLLAPRMSKSCKTLLAVAAKHRIGARLTAALTTGQPPLSQRVTLTRH